MDHRVHLWFITWYHFGPNLSKLWNNSYSGRCSCRFFLKFLQKTWRCWRWTFSQNTGKIRDMIDLFRGFCCVCNFVGSWFLQTIMTIGSIFPGKKGCSCCLLVFRPCSKKKMLIRFFYSAKFSLKNENLLVPFVISYQNKLRI